VTTVEGEVVMTTVVVMTTTVMVVVVVARVMEGTATMTMRSFPCA
jgi:hypothetical protein